MIINEFVEVIKVLWESIGEFAQIITGRDKGTRYQIVVALISIFLAISVGIVGNLISKHINKQQEFSTQLKSLNEVEDSLKNLVTFVEAQKHALSESQSIIDRLKKEEQKLRPVVEADRRMVDAVLQAQAAYQRKEIWIERIVAFFLGIASSIVASFVYSSIRSVLRRRRQRA